MGCIFFSDSRLRESVAVIVNSLSLVVTRQTHYLGEGSIGLLCRLLIQSVNHHAAVAMVSRASSCGIDPTESNNYG
jgi:hypothetical protein